jgi:hypothetical protein
MISMVDTSFGSRLVTDAIEKVLREISTGTKAQSVQSETEFDGTAKLRLFRSAGNRRRKSPQEASGPDHDEILQIMAIGSVQLRAAAVWQTGYGHRLLACARSASCNEEPLI